MKNTLEILKKHKIHLLEGLAIFFICIYCYSISPVTLQNDTFYTIPIGNLIMENGIDMKDHYSWHNDLPYEYPHWLFDVIMASIYNIAGWKGIYITVCVLSACLGLTIYFVNVKLTKSRLISFFVAIGVMYILQDYIAARAQLVTFIIYMFVIYNMEKFLENPKKIRYSASIIISSILIANLHVAVWPFLFIISLPYIAEWIIACIADVLIYGKINILIQKIKLKRQKNNPVKVISINEKIRKIYEKNERIKKVRESSEPYKIRMSRNKNVKWFILLMIICGLTGLLTPLKFAPYTYLAKTVKGTTTMNINEHLPLTLFYDKTAMATLIIIFALVTFTKIKIKLSDLFMIMGLMYLMISSKRQITMFALMGSITMTKMIIELIQTYTKFKIEELEITWMSVVGVLTFSILIMFLSSKNIEKKRKDEFIEEKTYPVKAAEWILENLDINNIRLFNEYNYGSYLLYKGIPVFIDSRADLYAPEFNGKNGENGKDIFMDFINTSNIGIYYGSTFEKYDITHVILYKNSKMSMLIDKAEPERYNKIYNDKYFVIYEIVK